MKKAKYTRNARPSTTDTKIDDIGELIPDKPKKKDKRGKYKASYEKKEKFLVWKMWSYYLATLFNKDRGTIPDNIGDRILISSNTYTTRLYISSVIHVTQCSLMTPVMMTQLLVEYLRSKKCTAVVDFTFKNKIMPVMGEGSGITARKRNWENTMNSGDIVLDRMKETAARCLYTCELMESGTKLYYTRMYIILRAKTGTELKFAETKTFEFLEKCKSNYRPITSNLSDILSYISILSDRHNKTVKDYKALVTSSATLSQLLANTGAFNGEKGLNAGINILNYTHYNIDFEAITIARNIYICAPAGVGKTVICINMLQSALEKDSWRVFVNDIKGNEFTAICKAIGGIVLSLTPKSTQYINTFKMDGELVTKETAKDYFLENLKLSKNMMIILSGIQDRDELLQADKLIDDFLNYVYINKGVLAENRGTWSNTSDLNPYEIYDLMERFIGPKIILKYSLCAEKLLNNLNQYMSRRGSRSYIFKEEFNMQQVYNATMIVASYGMLKYQSIGQIDVPLFELKSMYADYIKGHYVEYNYAHSFETLVVDEESQIATPRQMKGYVEDFTLRRAQRQTTILLGNSVNALMNNEIAAPLIENVRGIFIGDLQKDARQRVIEAFDLQEYESLLRLVGSSEEFYNSFLFINRMEPEPLVPIIKVRLPENKKLMQFTPEKEIV